MANVKPFLNKIREAIKGKEVRGSLADGLEAVNKETEEATKMTKETEHRQTVVEQQFDDVLAGWTNDKPIDNAETIAGRTNRETGENYSTIGQRLDTENQRVRSELVETKETLIGKDLNYIYVDARKGDGNDGQTPETAVRTLRKAFELLRGIGSKASFGVWVIKIKGYGDEYTYDGYKSDNLPPSQKIIVEGDTDANGLPYTVFKKDKMNIGIWIEPGVRLMHVKNIMFKGFKSENDLGNGYGILMKNQGAISIENCIAQDCNNGFAGINNVSIKAKRTISMGCTIGYRVQYCSSGNFGDSYGGALYDDGGQGSKAIDCVRGVYVSRNAVAHVDYMNIENCSYAGVAIDMASRVHVVGTHFKRNNFGVRAEGGSEWINNTNEPNNFYMDSALDKNRVVFGHFGVSRETRMYSQDTTNEYRVSVKSSDVVKSGNERESLWRGSELGKIPAYWFITPAKRIRIVVHGTNRGSAIKTLTMYTTDKDAQNTAALASGSISKQGVFRTEFTIFAQGENTQKQITNTQYAYDIPGWGVYTRNVSTDIDRLFNLTAEMSEGTSSDKLIIHSLEIYFMG